MSFARIRGQEKAIEYLARALTDGSLAHAYLFAGPAGVGKTTTALNFAKAILCPSRSVHEPCDRCSSCRRIDSMSHPDVMVLAPSKTASGVSIEQIREMIRVVSLKPFEAAKKVCIVEKADAMTPQASNALLKTLEEPAEDSIIIVIASSARALVPTIVSRCHIIRFFPMAYADAEKVLTQEYAFKESEAYYLAHLASGRIGEAIRLRESGAYEKRNTIIDSLIRREPNLYDQAADMPESLDAEMILDISLSWFRDLAIAKTGSDERLLFNIDKKGEIARQAAGEDLERLHESIGSILALKASLKAKANPKLVLGVLSATIMN